jgi:hypothetical protein
LRLVMAAQLAGRTDVEPNSGQQHQHDKGEQRRSDSTETRTNPPSRRMTACGRRALRGRRRPAARRLNAQRG